MKARAPSAAAAGMVAALLGASVASAQAQPSTGPAPAPPAPAAEARPPCQDFTDLLTPGKPYPVAYRVTNELSFTPADRATITDVLWKMAQGEVGARCLVALGQGRAPEFAQLLERQLATGGTSFPSGADVLCALHPRASWAITWMVKERCIAGLAEIDDQPAAAQAVDAAVAHALRKNPDAHFRNTLSDWVVDNFDARWSPKLRARLAPVLRPAYERQADGYESLWNAECSDNWGPPVLPASTCTELEPVGGRWEDGRVRRHKIVRAGLVLAPAAGVVALAAVERNAPSGRGIAVASLAVGAGLAVGTLVGVAIDHGPDPYGVGAFYGTLFGALAGAGAAVAAGVISYDALGASPRGRVAVAATGMALFSAWALVVTFE